MDLSRELQEALIAARLAGDYARREYERFTPISDAPASISTHVDHAAQELILKHLRAAFPNDGLVAEERTASLEGAPSAAARVWIVDPIDGTRGFAMKNGEFSVMVGLTIGGRPVVGVVLEPVSSRVTYAASGTGCWVVESGTQPRNCQVTGVSSLSDSTLVQSHTKPGKPPKPVVTALRPARVIETYSAGLKLAMVARGEVDLYVNDYVNFHDWDACAGHILVEEAGGQMSLFDGNPITYGGNQAANRRGMIASNGRVHEEVVKRLVDI